MRGEATAAVGMGILGAEGVPQAFLLRPPEPDLRAMERMRDRLRPWWEEEGTIRASLFLGWALEECLGRAEEEAGRDTRWRLREELGLGMREWEDRVELWLRGEMGLDPSSLLAPEKYVENARSFCTFSGSFPSSASFDTSRDRSASSARYLSYSTGSSDGTGRVAWVHHPVGQWR